jgi:hypothetical protein
MEAAAFLGFSIRALMWWVKHVDRIRLCNRYVVLKREASQSK